MSIVENRKAFHEYFIEEQIEAGMVLEGWEVKAIRAGKMQIAEAYVTITGTEIFLFGSHLSPLESTSTHVKAEPMRTRKLLLTSKEIDRLIGKVKLAGYTLMPLNLHYSKGRIKCQIGLAKGKKQHDKRADQKDKDAKREINQIMKQHKV